jgi:6-pyruvoyltetrahydropterin/6-carboxytetrahydropterin synthase
MLPQHDGKCRRLHGHSWVGRVFLQPKNGLVTVGPKSGMVQDFGEVSAVLKPFVDDNLDHWYLNESTKLANPTSEELARWIFERLYPKLPLLVAVEILETCTSSCRYSPEW